MGNMMIEILAACFFGIVLLAPLAVIVLTLHASWNRIISALLGQDEETTLPVLRAPRVRAVAALPLPRHPQSQRAAA
jgi:hypothetical protein